MVDLETPKNPFDNISDDWIIYICGASNLDFNHIITFAKTCKRFLVLITRSDRADVLLKNIAQEEWEYIQGEVTNQRILYDKDQYKIAKMVPTFKDTVDYLFEISYINDSWYKKCQLLYSGKSHHDGIVYGSFNYTVGLHGWGIMCMHGEVIIGKFECDDLKYGKIIGIDGNMKIGHFDGNIVKNLFPFPRNSLKLISTRKDERIFQKKKFADNNGTLITYTGSFTFTYTGIFGGNDLQSGIISGKNWIIKGNFVSKTNPRLFLDHDNFDRLYLSNNCVLQVPEENFSVSLPFGDGMYTRIRESEITSYLPPSVIKCYDSHLCRTFHSKSNRDIPTVMVMGGLYTYCLYCIKNCVNPYPVDENGTLVTEMRLFTTCCCYECIRKIDRDCKECVWGGDQCVQCTGKLIQPTQKRAKLDMSIVTIME